MLDTLAQIADALAERASGPMKFRLLMQPTIAIIFAVRAALRDARTGAPPFLWAAITRRGHRLEILKRGWKDVGKVFVIAAVLDLVYQKVVGVGMRPLDALGVAAILAFVPYVLIRGPLSRLIRRAHANPTGQQK